MHFVSDTFLHICIGGYPYAQRTLALPLVHIITGHWVVDWLGFAQGVSDVDCEIFGVEFQKIGIGGGYIEKTHVKKKRGSCESIYDILDNMY